MTRKKYNSIDEYILDFPVEVRSILKKIRAEIKSRIPKAEETISYNMPAFKSEKPFFYFAAFKKHIGIYPPVKDKVLKKKLKSFMNEKGNLAFPFELEIPIKVIGDVAVALFEEK
jgi:uncharacterized protein YdhG (YjbR/CyaY superfamily)